MSQSERSVLVDEATYYDLRDLSGEIDDALDGPMQSPDGASEVVADLLERAAGILRELVWKYEESQSVEDNTEHDRS